ncbi:flagellar assembly protein FliW [Thermosipho ferrireducens]|uniref:Flagellar assembly factor FliW n=1 Tax=Thermosipho ferrireducens TaxID=2571116 RepID=A0ABX7S3Z6_9BACT|nr:flagellar assembly protein FliW [Thermosipho ferrireducens]QTA37121.1 flagellar assembly protein FliW [Thermosipho ferrireducens]
MIFKTKFGEIDLQENEIITFPNGLPGFDNLRKFAIISFENTSPILWLVSLEDSNITLPIVDPWIFLKDYEFEISEEDIKELQINSEEDIAIWAVLTIPKGKPKETTINLLAPIVINIKKGIGKQIILNTEKYTIKHHLRELVRSQQKR